MQKKFNSNLVKIVAILNDGHYHDGTRIGEQLNMTRSAVWKSIKKLENYKIQITSTKGKGYVLREPLILLDPAKIKKLIKLKLPAAPAIHLDVFESLASTNAYLKTIKESNSIKVCLAERQTAGKGRLNRDWHSPFARNIYLSCLYPFQKEISELSGLTLVISLAVYAALRQMGVNEKLSVKWPNDIIYENKKISGGLIEIQAETHGRSHVVIGVGVNVNMLNAETKYISQPWTSVQQILGKYIDRNYFAVILINHLLDYSQRFEEQGLQSFMAEWKKADGLAEQNIAIKNVNGNIEGKVMGINEQGHLLLKLKNGNLQAFSSGEATIIKDNKIVKNNENL